jgi:nitrogenase molybdenum-iron protein NifN
MPLGGIIAFRGIAGAMPLVHGSQGCSTYMRLTCVNHFNEPVDIASSSLNEKQTIHGGEANLKKALDNVRQVYRPSVVGLMTTCLSETMGEDLDRIIRDYEKERGGTDCDIIPVPTPSYGGTHTEGYWAATKAVVAFYARHDQPDPRINVIVPHVSPADVRELKRILTLMGVEFTLLPDYSLTFDRPYQGTYQKIPDGGTKASDIAAMAGAPFTVEFGETCPEHLSPGHMLEERYDVPLFHLPLPTGLEATDRFIALLQEKSGRTVPESLAIERGWLLDAMADAHKFNAEGRAVIFGEPELVAAVTRTCTENGIFPAVIATGTSNSRLAACIGPLTRGLDEEPVFLEGTDFSMIETAAVRTGANLAIGHSGGRVLTEHHGIPLVRTGFPVHDRVGGQRTLSAGYAGTLGLLDRITNALLEQKHRTYRRLLQEEMNTGGLSEGV